MTAASAFCAFTSSVGAQQVAFSIAQQEFEAGIRQKDTAQRVAAVKKFAALGEPGAVKVLVDAVQKSSRKVEKTRVDYERVGEPSCSRRSRHSTTMPLSTSCCSAPR
jgi:hypothetical protein